MAIKSFAISILSRNLHSTPVFAFNFAASRFQSASLHASTNKVSPSNSDAVSILSCFTAASNLD